MEERGKSVLDKVWSQRFANLAPKNFNPHPREELNDITPLSA
jgi:hypothetical protein